MRVSIFFAKSEEGKFEKKGIVIYTQQHYSVDHTAAILNSILVITVLIQILLTKIWTQ